MQVEVLRDGCGMLVLCCRNDRSQWHFAHSVPIREDSLALAGREKIVDRGCPIVERLAARDFAHAGGASTDSMAELASWKTVFVRRRVTRAKTMVRRAIEGTLDEMHGSAGALQHVRKKDLPDPDDKVGIRRLLTSHSLQQYLVTQRIRPGRRRQVVGSASHALEGSRRVWNAPSEQMPLPQERRQSVLTNGGDLEALDRPVRCPTKRVLLDAMASPRECALTIGAAVVGMDVVDAEAAAHGESVIVVSPPSSMREELGEGAVRLVSLLCWRVLCAVRREFGEERPLYLAGAMLTRTQPPAGASPEYDYGVAHVDRANMASYDYSAVLYLNTQGRGFEGGDFAFVDARDDEVVEPRAGRCVLFASGFEHLHRVGKVKRGSRFVLASWFTLNRASGVELQRAEYDVAETAPPPSAADIEAEASRLDLLVRLAGGTLEDLEALVSRQ